MRREERKRKEQELLHDLIVKGGLKEEILETWQRETRKKKSAFYDRLAELSEEDKIRYESLTDRRMIDSNKLNDLIIYIEDWDLLYTADIKTEPRKCVGGVQKKSCANGGAKNMRRHPSPLSGTGKRYDRRSRTW